MIDKLFCEFLEYQICEFFKRFYNEQTRGFWCDGVVTPDADYLYTKKSIEDSRSMYFIAFVGKDGQQKYDVTLMLGNKALSLLIRGLDIKQCFSIIENPKFCKIDTILMKIEIRLE